MSSTINSKEQKILWGRAAARCSMSDCRRKLTFDKSNVTESITLGEMCHIVGEKNNAKSPRGLSKLPIDERNKYSNLILLCSHHHKIIDKDEDNWPIEVLHNIKDEHELWVEESLTSTTITPETIVYSNIIDNLNSYLKLDKYNWYIGNAVRNIIHNDLIDAGDYIEERLLAIDWPGTDKELEKSITVLMESFSKYINHFLKHASNSAPDYEFYREDTDYKQIYPNPNYHYISQRNMLWAKKNFFLLSDYIINLNSFVKNVRRNFNPLFHLKRGKFLIIDDFGMYHGGVSTIVLPLKKDVDEWLDKIDLEIESFEAENKKDRC
ncbi:hypothetical protein [uncultured Polaribacter sp.]|uniref:hypothetical protein n=1 Tax=uncultured Polaribacter sp. TaxID=174711 RepID=UPI002635342C|nr:hypothetical protein [uncultured Polaribacter sp.]